MDVERTLALLPQSPGVYQFRDETGLCLYVGRAARLRDRVRSYWGELGDRPRLRRMMPRIASVEPFPCLSEHEAALLENNLLQRRLPRFNRTRGTESLVWLDLTPRGLRVSYAPAEFGPYLGGERAAQAVRALHRIFPLPYCAPGLRGSEADLAATFGVGPGDAKRCSAGIAAVLRGEASAAEPLLALRDQAAAAQLFEVAAARQAELEGLAWVTAPLHFGRAPDVVVSATAGGLTVRLELRDGWVHRRTVSRVTPPTGAGAARAADAARSPGGAAGSRSAAGTAEPWQRTATQLAELYAALAAAGADPLQWRAWPLDRRDASRRVTRSDTGRPASARARA